MRFSRLVFFLTPAVLLGLPSEPADGVSPAREVPRKLATGSTSAEITSIPYFRILSFRAQDWRSLLFVDPGESQSGIRFLLLENSENRQIAHPLDRPPQTRKMSAAEDEAAFHFDDPQNEIQFESFLQLSDQRLVVRCKLTNTSSGSRELSLWAIASVPSTGMIVTPFSRGLEDGRWSHPKVTGFWATPLSNPGLRLGTEGFALDLDAWDGEAVKFGTRSSASWIATVDPESGGYLMASMPYSAGDRYPDEDCNVTLWAGELPGSHRHGEMEWMSPWKMLAAGESFVWTFTLEIGKIPLDATRSVDDFIAAILSANVLLPPAVNTTRGAWRFDAQGPLIKDRFGRVTAWQDSDQKTIVRSPFWQNAPVWLPDGPALEWKPGTIVKTELQQVPAWSEQGRQWMVEFSADKPADSAERVLLRDGDAETGCLLAVGDQSIDFYVWDHGAVIGSIRQPLPAADKVHVTVTLDGGDGAVSMEINGERHDQGTGVALSRMPSADLEIGRSKASQIAGLPELVPFSGKIFRVEITPNTGP